MITFDEKTFFAEMSEAMNNEIVKRMQEMKIQQEMERKRNPLLKVFGDEVEADLAIIHHGESTGNERADSLIDKVFGYYTNGFIKEPYVAWSPFSHRLYVKAPYNKQVLSHTPLGGGVYGRSVVFTGKDENNMFSSIPCLGMEYDRKNNYFSKLCL